MATRRLNIARLLRPYWKLLAVAFGAMLVQGVVDLLEPWPLKIIFDYVISTKPRPWWLAGWFEGPNDRLRLLDASLHPFAPGGNSILN